MSNITATATATAKNLSMAAIKSAMPEYFAANLTGLVKAMGNKSANIENLSLALVGACLEVAQSGNKPKSWIDADSQAQILKGAQKACVNAALSHVMAIGNASLKSDSLEVYTDFAAEHLKAITDKLTPAIVAKPASDKETSKQTIERLTAELAAMTIERDILKAALVKANIEAPASEALV